MEAGHQGCDFVGGGGAAAALGWERWESRLPALRRWEGRVLPSPGEGRLG